MFWKDDGQQLEEARKAQKHCAHHLSFLFLLSFRPTLLLLTVLSVFSPPAFAASEHDVYKKSGAYDPLIISHARKAGLPEALVYAVIHQESRFNHLVVSPAGAQGLMQLMPATARRFHVTNPFIPAQNIRAGTTYLAWLLKRFKGNVRLALAGYNAGEGAVDRYKGMPPYKETRNYVKKVMGYYRQYAGLMPSQKTPARLTSKPVTQVVKKSKPIKKKASRKKHKPRNLKTAKTNIGKKRLESTRRVHSITLALVAPLSGYTRIRAQTKEIQ